MSWVFLSGMLTASYLVAALFFLQFWRRTRDRLFVLFSVAFALLGLAQALLALSPLPIEDRSWIYLIRLLAFLIILAAIYGKNREGAAR